VAEQRALDIDWCSLSLDVINADREISDEHRVRDDAVTLFDHIVGLAAIPGVYEIKRGSSGPPQYGPRP
jgi:hypothetical protein